MQKSAHEYEVSLMAGDGIASLREVAPLWEALWERTPSRTAFSLPAWSIAWWRAYGEEFELRCIVVRHQGTPVALFPFALDRERTLRLLPTPDADYGDMVGDPAHAGGALAAALDHLARAGGWDRVQFINVRQDALLRRALDELPGSWRQRLMMEEGEVAPAAVAEGDVSAMYSAFVGKKSLRQFTRKLASTLGDLSLVHAGNAAEAREQFGVLLKQHEERSAVAGRRSQFLEDPRQRALFLALIQELDPASTLRLSVLWAGPHPVACHFGFESAGRFIYYKPTFDVDYWELSAGQVLLVKMFEYAQGRALPVFDFSIGDESYKYRFANQVVPTSHYLISRTPLQARLRRLSRSLRRQLRARPVLHRTLTRLLGRSPEVNDTLRAARLEAYVVPASGSREEIVPVRLSELARLAIADPGAFPPSALDGMRVRLRRGEQCVALRAGDAVRALGWLRDPGDGQAVGGWTGPLCHDAWIGPGEDLSASLARLAQLAGQGESLLMLVTPGPQAAAAAAQGWVRHGSVTRDALEPPGSNA
jgi:CelD/BcsL family acetyltransferase involved in cellulose biosynthesis